MGIRPGRVEGVLEQIFAAYATTELRPELRLERTQRHPAVLAGVGAVADEPTRQLGLAPLRHVIVGEEARGHEREPGERAVRHRHVHELPLARGLPLV